MSGGARIWTVRLTGAAETDFNGILRWTAGQFGERQARVYSRTLSATLTALTAGPDQIGVRTRDDIANGILTIHVARKRRKGRHFVMFRVDLREDAIEVLRLLHDAMDPQLHLP